MLKIGCSYFGNYHLRHVKTDFQELKETGFNSLTLCLSEHDLQFYKQTCIEMVALAKDLEFEVYLDPWGLGKVFGGEPYSWFVAKYPSECQVLEDGTQVPHACPNSKAFREYVSEWIHAACSTQADYLLWDEPHLYIPGWAAPSKGTFACHCRTCQKNFRNIVGYKLPKIMNDDIKNWQITVLLDFLNYCTQLTHTQGKKNIVIFLPNIPGKHGGISWDRVGELNHLSMFGTDPYWVWDKQELEPYVRQFSAHIKSICDAHHWEPQIWLQAMDIPAGLEDDMVRGMQLCMDEGIRNIQFWSYNCCQHISWVRCGNAELGWKKICDAVKMTQDKYR